MSEALVDAAKVVLPLVAFCLVLMIWLRSYR